MPESSGIEVSKPCLEEFARFVDDHTARGLGPGVDQTRRSHQLGTQFGGALMGMSPALQDARRHYQACLVAANQTVGEYLRASQVLVSAITRVKQNYGNADDAAAAGNDAILLDAMRQAARSSDAQRASDGATTPGGEQGPSQPGADAV